MRKLVWMIVLIFGYIWSVTSGNDQFIYDQAKKMYSFVTHWLEDAELDFQVRKHPPIEEKKIKAKKTRKLE